MTTSSLTSDLNPGGRRAAVEATAVWNPDRSIGLGESTVVLVALFFFSGALLNENQGYATGTLEENSFLSVLQFAVYLSFLPFAVKHRKAVLRASRSLYMIWAVMVLAVLSTAWSEVALDTFKHSILLIITTIFGLYFGVRFELKEQLRLLTIVLGVSVVLSFALTLLFPDIGIMKFGPVGSWRGIYFQRNTLAHSMVIAFAVFWLRGRSSGFRGWTYAALVGAAALVLLSGSVTGILLLVMVMIFLKGSFVLRWKRRTLITVAVLSIPILLFSVRGFLPHYASLMEALGRDWTLDGRVYIWVLSGVMALRRPWLGYGLTAFWLGPAGPSANVWRAMKWPAPNAHNGFIDVWLSVGLVGLFMLLVQYAKSLWRAFTEARSAATNAPATLWPLTCLLILLVDNLVETNLLEHNHIAWVLFVAACVPATRTLRTVSVSSSQ